MSLFSNFLGNKWCFQLCDF
uniref:Uncharacterized protein n=1 Tax=Rhizophora mucronata TaxID=61149 RepID=A0A2P2NDV0_RHIMU